MHGLSIYFMAYNFVLVYQRLWSAPAMVAGVMYRLWEMSDIVMLVDEAVPKRAGQVRIDGPELEQFIAKISILSSTLAIKRHGRACL